MCVSVCVTENEYEDDEYIQEESGASRAPRGQEAFVVVKIGFITPIKTQSALCNGEINDWESEEDLAFNRCHSCN